MAKRQPLWCERGRRVSARSTDLPDQSSQTRLLARESQSFHLSGAMLDVIFPFAFIGLQIAIGIATRPFAMTCV